MLVTGFQCLSHIRDLREEADLLKEAAETLIHHAPARERFAFVHQLRDRIPARRVCRIIATDHSSYFARAPAETTRTARALDHEKLLQLIVKAHTAHPARSAARITRELKRHGTDVGRRRVARIMSENRIAGITRRKRRNLTKPDQGAAAIPDLIRRQFTAPMPGLKLTGDISCFRTTEGWIYLATVIDLCSKEMIGWAIASHMRSSLVINALNMAHSRGLTAGNAIMHTDRGQPILREGTPATPRAPRHTAIHEPDGILPRQRRRRILQRCCFRCLGWWWGWCGGLKWRRDSCRSFGDQAEGSSVQESRCRVSVS